jgi:hypothetical protein
MQESNSASMIDLLLNSPAFERESKVFRMQYDRKDSNQLIDSRIKDIRTLELGCQSFYFNNNVCRMLTFRDTTEAD